jgi:hypothetical protein
MPAFILPSLLSDISLDLKLDFLLYIDVKAAVQILFFTASGFLLGKVSKSKAMYFAAFGITLVTSMFASVTLRERFLAGHENYTKSIVRFVLGLLCIDFDNSETIPGYAFGFSSYRDFWPDKVFYIFPALILFAFIFYKRFGKPKDKIITASAVCVSALCAVFTIVGAYDAAPRLIQPFIQIEPQPGVYKTVLDPAYDNGAVRDEYENLRVVSYEMDIDLRRDFRSNCTVTLENIGGADFSGDIQFRLAPAFTVESAGFTQSGFYITRNMSIPAGGQISLDIAYRGDVNYVSPINMRSAFADNKVAYLPERFAWYPKLETVKTPTAYTATIRADNNIVSNLSNNETAPRAKEITLSKTLEKDLYLLCGYYKTDVIDGITVTASQDLINSDDQFIKDMRQSLIDNSPLYDEPLINWQEEVLLSPLPQEELATKKLLFMPAVYDGADICYVLDDSILIPDYWFGVTF